MSDPDEYSEAWNALGLPDPDESFGAEWGADEARTSAFSNWLRPRSDVDADFASILTLISLEPSGMARAGMYRLVMWKCSLEQLSVLLAIENNRPWVEEEMLLRRLDGDPSEEQLIEVLKTSTRKVQLKMLDKKPLPKSVLEHLATQGITKAIRNRAAERLRSHEGRPDEQ